MLGSRVLGEERSRVEESDQLGKTRDDERENDEPPAAMTRREAVAWRQSVQHRYGG